MSLAAAGGNGSFVAALHWKRWSRALSIRAAVSRHGYQWRQSLARTPNGRSAGANIRLVRMKCGSLTATFSSFFSPLLSLFFFNVNLTKNTARLTRIPQRTAPWRHPRTTRLQKRAEAVAARLQFWSNNVRIRKSDEVDHNMSQHASKFASAPASPGGRRGHCRKCQPGFSCSCICPHGQ